MTSYTNDWGLPKPDAADLIAGSSQNLRRDIGALADKTDQSLTQAKAQVKDELDPRFENIESVTNAGPVYTRGTLDAEQSLNSMHTRVWNGIYTISSTNANPGLPATPGIAGQLIVQNTGNDNSQKITFRAGQGTYERIGYGSNWGSWTRTDAPFARKGTLPDGMSPDSLTSALDQGAWYLSPSNTHPGLPDNITPTIPATIYNLTDGTGQGIQLLVLAFAGGTYWRPQTGQDRWGEWSTLGAGNGGNEASDTRLRLLELATTPISPFESTNRFTEQQDVESYMNWLATRHPQDVEILDLGASREGRPMRAYQLGDPTKPALYILATQHGNEPMGHEASHILVRDLLEDPPQWLPYFLQDACIIVTPLVNPDRLLESRGNSAGTDLNRNWETRTAAEVQAASSVLASHDVVLTVDAHEGANNLDMMGSPATAPEVAASLKTMGQTLCDHLDDVFTTAGHSWVPWTGGNDLNLARNSIAHVEKSTTIVLEGPSLLSTNMYYPSVITRRTLYTLGLHSVVDHFRQNLADYVTAKTQALS